MLIREIDIRAFGKLRDKKISLEEGLNVIYGLNESGKTTIHSFIGGMLYGFLKPGVKSAIYNPEHSKYTPWFGEAYGGRLTLIKNGVGYVIDRSFVKGREMTKIIEEATGEEVTSQMRLGPSGRIAQPGYQFIGVSSSIFYNTIYVGQRAIDTDSRLTEEIREKMINAASTGNDSISVEKALKLLDRKSADIGTNRTSRTWFGQLSRRLADIEERLNELNEIRNRYDSASIKRQELSAMLDHKVERYNYLVSLADHFNGIRRRNKRLKIDSIVREIKKLELKCLDIEPYSILVEEDLEECYHLESDIRLSKDRISGLDEQWCALQDQFLRLFDNKERTEELKQIIEDGHKAEGLNSSAGYATRETVEKEIRSNEVKKRNTSMFFAVTACIYIIGSGVLLQTKNYSLLLFIQPFLIAGLLLYFSIIKSAKAIAEQREKLQYIVELEAILSENGKSTLKDFWETFENAKLEISSSELNRLRRMELEESMLAIEERRKQELVELSMLEKQLAGILLDNRVSDTLEFKAGLRNKALYSKFKAEISNKQIQLKSLEGEIASLPKESEEAISLDIEKLPIDFDEECMLKELSELDEELKNLRMAIKELDGRIIAYEESLGDKIEMEEERDLCRQKLFELETEKKAIDLATLKIKSISAEMHRDFAPVLNKEVSEAIRVLTAGTYNSAKIDKMLSARVMDDSTGRLLNIDDLSGGTADQLYLALRIGMLKSLVPGNTPLFFDECFQQYDSIRLEASLSLILEESRERQILLFTSHEREMYLLDKLGKSYNLIELN